MSQPASTIGSMVSQGTSDWKDHFEDYEALIHGSSADSKYLRDTGLKPNILDLISRPIGHALDVGCGDGWLFDAIKPESGCECDVVDFGQRGRPWDFSVQDVSSLEYHAGSFDLVVGSLLLMWVDDLATACRELLRVARPGGQAVISIMHPASYRMGDTDENGDFVVRKRYDSEFVIQDLYIAKRAGPFRYSHRPLTRYFDALIRTGWRITEFREWTIDLADYHRRFPHPPGVSPSRTDRLPMYAFFQCRKDG